MASDFLDYLKSKQLRFESDFSIIVIGEVAILEKELENYNVGSKRVYDGVRIGFEHDGFYIFANYTSAINKNSQKPLSITVESLIIYQDNRTFNTNTFVNNFAAFNAIIACLSSSRICAHEDTLHEKLIFLSKSQGRLDLSFAVQGYEEMYFSEDFSLFLHFIEEHKGDEKARSILKDTIIAHFSKSGEIKENIFEIFRAFYNIRRNFSRDYDLYNSQFSFESLKHDLEEEKKEFLHDYAKFYADFMPKIYGVPLQIGAYVLIVGQVIRINNPLLGALFTIMVFMVGLYSNKLISISNELLDDSIDEFNEKIKKAKEKTNDNFEHSTSLTKKIARFSDNIKYFKWLNTVTHVLFFFAGFYLFIDELFAYLLK